MSHFIEDFTWITAKNLRAIVELIDNGENITTLWLPGTGRTVLSGELQEKEQMKRFFPDKHWDELVFISLDMSLSEKFLLLQIKETLEILTSETNLTLSIQKIVNSGKRIVFLLDNLDFKDIELVKYIFSLRSIRYDKINFVIMPLEKDFHNLGEEEIQLNTILTHNIVKVAYYNKDETFEWIEKNRKRHSNIEISDEYKEEMYSFSGGIPAILRSFIRGLEKNQTIEEVKDSDEMISSLERLWARFNEKEQSVIKRANLTGTFPPHSDEVRYLRDHNVIDGNTTVGKWIEIFTNSNNAVTFKVSKSLILWEQLEVNEILSKNENKIFQFLLKNFDKVSTKEEVGSIIWDSENGGIYSEWAIDQVISRLRKKLRKLGIKQEIIRTIKNKGYKIENATVSIL